MARISIAEIMQLLSEHNLLVSVDNTVSPSLTFDGISYNSKAVSDNSLFFCKGNFKAEYLGEAEKNGAIAYMAEEHYSHAELPGIIVINIQKSMSLISAAFFGFPQNKLATIAFTGTKGKTTSSYLTKSILDKQFNGQVGLFSTINTVVGPNPDEDFKSHLTTPESLDLFTNMDRVASNGWQHLVMEVSSQAYKKNRVYGLHYDIGVFLNISPDHIGRNEHPTFADYLLCKEQLIVNSDQVILNADDDHILDTFMTAKATTQPEKIYLMGRKGVDRTDSLEIDFEFETLSDTLKENRISLAAVSDKAKKLSIDGEYEIGISGDYNEYNGVAAAIASSLLGVNKTNISSGLANIVIPGRMESYQAANHGDVYVDYAHNYASMDAVLKFLKTQDSNGKVFVVTGSAGDKGIDRRPGLGKAISEGADIAYLTSDDPGFENPEDIAATIRDNIDEMKVTVNYIEDRETAIKAAIDASHPGDIVLVAGKGRDPYQKIKGVDTHYDGDSKIVENYTKGME
ncbi:UDP-N-acetylmuramoyl-L-alanyl-D-glutamate--2,6-diaminopimelate ligase [Lentilactobacillus sp. Marseille-Q4993]|uniref:UDP-N-acetylmuramoyl-L-alanyl-D-glutamate--2, 6-diaminopimelate ligase n=1 Tax=Lentilactobacillus sp. Marseille-Q4993 TaxID=3039492 RepID=UPI0024BCEE15|nr:UDP-N-acetylmuramoyl-L-alanyl-D-glutamate--2,6-diaminopimelate ligase [Lentilactobacillus sp. Marseille-Q4993]